MDITALFGVSRADRDRCWPWTASRSAPAPSAAVAKIRWAPVNVSSIAYAIV